MMNAKRMKVGEIALQLNVTPNTVRNWCRRYAAYLSDSANPPGGGERSFTVRDLNVFTYIHKAMNDGVNHHEIALNLAEKTFSSDGEDIVIGLTEVVPPQSPPKPQEAHSNDVLLPVALSTITGRQDATDKRIDALQLAIASMERRQGERNDALVTGIVIGGAVVLIVVAVVTALGGS